MRTDLNDAIRIIRSRARVAAVEVVPVQDAAGRIAARPVIAPDDYPPFDRSRMDGYAVCGKAPYVGSEFRVVGTIFAADSYDGRIGEGECVRLATGSMIPDGADAVVPEEDVERVAETVRLVTTAVDQSYIERRGTVCRAGDELFAAGVPVDHRHVEQASAVRIDSIPVRVPPRIGIISTGGEITERFSSVTGILNSNAYMLRALCDSLRLPHRYFGLMPDALDELVGAFDRARRDVDIVVSFGGTSVGRADMIKQAIEVAGGEVLIAGIEASPGKTFTFGVLDDTPILMMPGTPAAATACAELFIPALAGAWLAPERKFVPVTAIADFTLERRAGYAKMIGCFLSIEDGRAVCRDRRDNTPQRPMLRGIAVLPPDMTAVNPGTLLDVYVTSFI